MNHLNNSLIEGRVGAGAGAQAGVGVQETVKKGGGVLLSLVGAPGGPLISLF